MAAIEGGNTFPGGLLHGLIRKLIASSPDQMAQAVTSERVAAKQDDVHDEHKCSKSDAEMTMTVGTCKKHRLDRVISENDDEQERNVKKIPVDVL